MDEMRAIPRQSLARRNDFDLGLARISPSTRSIAGPNGSVVIEPKVMQVLLALADALGETLSRDDLLQECWTGVFVGDDAVNRTIAAIRKAIRETGAGFHLETIARVGYRLTVDENSDDPQTATADRSAFPIVRRSLMVCGAVTAVLVAGGGAAAIWRGKREAETDAMIERGGVLLATGVPADVERAQAVFRAAIARSPDRADAWGGLARALSYEEPNEARKAAMAALERDPEEANARTALWVQRRDLANWTEWEDGLLSILNDAPDNAFALSHITFFYQAVGRCVESLRFNERAIRVEPFQPSHIARRAIKHWIFGLNDKADRVANQALRLWPRHPLVWNARMLIYAFTDRAQAGLALLNDRASRPTMLTEPSTLSWRAALRAIDSRSKSDIAQATASLLQAASLAPGIAANAIMVLSWLGELDAAYDVAAGLLGGRGKLVQATRSGGKDLYSGPDWGRTQSLFLPATAAFRADLRFTDLCRMTGHLEYWSRRGIWPDAFVRGSLPASL